MESQDFDIRAGRRAAAAAAGRPGSQGAAGPTQRGRRVGEEGGGGSPDCPSRAGRREDAEAAARLWMQSAEEHTSPDPVYATAPGAEKTMRRFLADLARNGYAFVFVATVGDRMVGFVSGELREGSPTFLPKTWASVDDVFVHPDHPNPGLGPAPPRSPGPPWPPPPCPPTTATAA